MRSIRPRADELARARAAIGNANINRRGTLSVISENDEEGEEEEEEEEEREEEEEELGSGTGLGLYEPPPRVDSNLSSVRAEIGSESEVSE